MKKFLFLLAVMVAVGFNAQAKHDSKHCTGGGFVDTSVPLMSVADVLKHKEDTYVMMQGYITKQLGGDQYSFTDGKDNIILEIDDKYWKGQTVSPKDMINIGGEIEKDDGKTVIDVKSLNLVK